MGNKYENEISDMLNSLLSEDQANKILDGLYPNNIEGYEIGDIMTLKELRSLPIDSVIHLEYYDEDGKLREYDFNVYIGIDNGEASTSSGYHMPVNDLSDDCLLKSLDNSGWQYTIRKSIKK